MEGVRIILGAAVLLRFGIVPARARTNPGGESGGWGVDACLTAHVGPAERAAYLPLLRAAGITVLREREPNAAMGALKAAGFHVVSFLGLDGPGIAQPGDALPEDLLAVFRAAREMQQRYGRWVDAWEMVGEPDVGYCRDLPDRVVAFQKAVYLGIKGAGPHPPLVLMGALALPPGPWLERAARNGIFDYTDADNFHFYGFAKDLAGVIRAHEAFASRWIDRGNRSFVVRADGQSGGPATAWRPVDRPPGILGLARDPFPLWITECGMDAVVPGDFFNAGRRRLQAEFTVTTAREARSASAVAVFMPFILVHPGDPSALTLAPDRALPAWQAYADFTRGRPFPARLLAMPPRAPNPIVVQWMPDNRTTSPHKVAGTYRFKEGQPIRGSLRIYNLGATPVRGRLEAGALHRVRLVSPDLYPADAPGAAESLRSPDITVPPMARVDVPVAFIRSGPGYSREYWPVAFVDDRGGRSPLYFGVETSPDPADFVPAPVSLEPVNRGWMGHADLDGDAVTSRSGPWTGINGLIVQSETPAEGSSAANGSPVPGEAAVVRIAVRRVSRDPLYPPTVIANVHDLPARGFVRLQLDRPMDAAFRVRVDLIDRQGQRFTVWENFGADYGGPANDVWLNLDDFHVYFWGRCSERPVLQPAEVDQIRLRCYVARDGDSREVRVSFWKPNAGLN